MNISIGLYNKDGSVRTDKSPEIFSEIDNNLSCFSILKVEPKIPFPKDKRPDRISSVSPYLPTVKPPGSFKVKSEIDGLRMVGPDSVRHNAGRGYSLVYVILLITMLS